MEINIRIFDFAKRTWSFSRSDDFIRFAKSEVKYWEDKKEKLSNKSNLPLGFNASNYFNTILQALERLENESDVSPNNVEKIKRQLNQNSIASLQNNWIWSGHSFTNRYIECYEEKGKGVATSFLDAVVNNSLKNPGDLNSLFGAIYAYEFLNQNSDLTKRRKTEKLSLERLRDKLSKEIIDINADIDDVKTGFSEWAKINREDWEVLKSSWKKEYEEKRKELINDFNQYESSVKQRLEGLESLYTEKLRLKKPAEYWSSSAKKFKNNSVMMSMFLFALVVTGLFLFYELFSEWLKGEAQAVNLGSLQGAILFFTLVAVYGFILRVVSKLTFSAVHLMRDAEEREQLTYLYLALTHENDIEKESRDIVLQALFSRSETGLISMESGPKMPGLSEIVASTVKTKT